MGDKWLYETNYAEDDSIDVSELNFIDFSPCVPGTRKKFSSKNLEGYVELYVDSTAVCNNQRIYNVSYPLCLQCILSYEKLPFNIYIENPDFREPLMVDLILSTNFKKNKRELSNFLGDIEPYFLDTSYIIQEYYDEFIIPYKANMRGKRQKICAVHEVELDKDYSMFPLHKFPYLHNPLS